MGHPLLIGLIVPPSVLCDCLEIRTHYRLFNNSLILRGAGVIGFNIRPKGLILSMIAFCGNLLDYINCSDIVKSICII